MMIYAKGHIVRRTPGLLSIESISRDGSRVGLYSRCFNKYYSISIVPGGFEVISLNTLETPLIS